MKLFFCGDIMPGGVLPYQKEFVSSALLQKMSSFDFRVGTLEAAIGTGLPYDQIKMQGRQNIIYARDEDFFRVKELGFDVVSLANNHVMDLGVNGLKNTISILKKNGIGYCGAGMNSEEASRPAIIEKDGLTVAVFAYCINNSPWLGYVELAGDESPGINPLDMDKVVSDIASAKKQYDIVIVMPHWGKEYITSPLDECIEMANRMVEAGADAVLGSHPHRIQPFIKNGGVPICFSMGNFMFPDFYMYPPRPIWYPEEEADLSSVKDVVGYPFPIHEPLRQVWRKVSRYGLCIVLSISNRKISARSFYVHNTDNNVVELGGVSFKERYLLWKESGIMSSSVLRFFFNCWRKLVRLIRKIL